MITKKWLDVNKSDDANPNIRPRMVGRELKLDNRLDLFAATPPSEALRIICSICASHQHQHYPPGGSTVRRQQAPALTNAHDEPDYSKGN